MSVLVSIGDFSRMTHLSVKALRHYHDVGLLAPAEIDPSSGYRRYDAEQVSVAQVIRRFRDLGMPLEEVKAVLDAPDVEARNAVIVAHLDRMESQLEQTRATVVSLRAVLEHPHVPQPVEYRSVGAMTCLADRSVVTMDEFAGWWMEAFTKLHERLQREGLTRAGADGALYSEEFFHEDGGEVVAFIPVLETTGAADLFEVPAAELAVTVHRGSFDELDQTYGSLGAYVAERAVGVPGPIREHYPVSPFHTDDESAWRTEVCWPIFQTTAT